jgi:hypothetical protein
MQFDLNNYSSILFHCPGLSLADPVPFAREWLISVGRTESESRPRPIAFDPPRNPDVIQSSAPCWTTLIDFHV